MVVVLCRHCMGAVEEERSSSPCCTKWQVLLCFNENMRCAEDVLRCHNDLYGIVQLVQI